ncbi:MAG TPA: CBS domain-containing protein [Thermoplasmata archaeon]|nr:CBS domain-containing protein [Thermoplasmata archaeon]
MALGPKRLEGWILSSGRRSLALRALGSGDVLTASQVARSTGRTVQNVSQALRELTSRRLAEIVGVKQRSWRHYRITGVGSEVLERMGPAPPDQKMIFRSDMSQEIDLKSVRDAYQLLVAKPVIAHPKETVHVALQRLLDEPRTRTLYVVDEDGHLSGVLPLVRILALLDSRLEESREPAVDVSEYAAELADLVGEHAVAATSVQLNQSLKLALHRMVKAGLEDIAVVDEQGALLGELNGFEVLTLALAASRRARPD